MSIYQPREDSLMLAYQVKKYAKGIVLDVGTGSGIQAKKAAEKANVKKIIAVDVSKKVISYCKKNIKIRKIKFLHSDLFKIFKRGKFKNMKFDTIIFNPPYLPEDHMKRDTAVIGGKKGYEVLERFLNEVDEYLQPDGLVLMTFSSLTNKNRVDETIMKTLFTSKLLHSTRLFFEELYAYLLKKSVLLKRLEKLKINNAKYFSRGKRGIIIKADYKNKKVGVKVKRPDSEAKGRINNEIKFLKIVNKKKIGPKFVFSENGMLVYEFVEGTCIKDWLPKAKKREVKRVFKNVLNQCFVLDRLGINKEEMHSPLKHVIIGKKVTLIDFERAHQTKDPKNVTQFLQFIMATKDLFKKKKKMKEMIQLAKVYKEKTTKENLNKLLKMV